MEDKTNYLQEYSSSTSLHGIRYLGETKTHPLEKLFWVLVILTFTSLCGNEVAKIFIKWKSSPVIVTFAQRSTNVANIPFPAVTICPETRIKRSVLDVEKNYDTINKQLQKSEYSSIQQKLLIEAMTLQCWDKKNPPSYVFTANFTPTARHIEVLTNEITPQFDEIFDSCRFSGEELGTCSEFVRPSMTGYGVCYTFNMLEESEFFTGNMKTGGVFAKPPQFVKKNTWDPQNGYKTPARNRDSYPLRSQMFASRFFGATFYMRTLADKDIQNMCSNSNESTDFRITLHPPVEFPDMYYGNIFRAAVGTETSVSIKPNLVTSSTSLRKMDPSIRQCFFDGEKNLTMFAFYTKINCMTECENQLFISDCKPSCSGHTYPLDTKKSGVQYCPLTIQNNNTLCGQQFQDKYDFHFDEERYDSLEKIGEPISCGCLPSCTEIQYDFSMSTLPLQQINNTRNNQVILSIYFDTESFVARQRTELYGITDVVANCGGLLSLFSGFSLVTLVEACYFATLRFACRLRRERRTEQLEAITVQH